MTGISIATTTQQIVLSPPEQPDIVLQVPAPVVIDLAAEGTQGPPAPLSWEYYAANWSVAPVQVGTTSAGTVYSYVFGGVTRYRLVPTVYDPTDDAFYSTFTGGVLSGLIVSRG